MNHISGVFELSLNECVVMSIVDFFRYSKNSEKHITHLKIVIHNREHQLNGKLKNCEFWLEQVVFFGCAILKDGMKVNPYRVKTISELLKPIHVMEIRILLSLISYYLWFINEFSNITSSLTNVLRKVIKFDCIEKFQKAFEESR